MSFYRKSKLAYLIIVQLAAKYTKALLLGFFCGLFIALGGLRLSPFIRHVILTPAVRIGIVGEFTPTTLPLSIQKRISIGLTDVAADGTAVPALADSWEATDSGKTVLFHLNPNFTWHNGKKVDAKDVNYNIRGVTFEPVGADTLRVTLPTSYSPFPVLVSKPIFQAGLRGFGPYRVTNIRLHGDAVTFLKLVPTHDFSQRALEFRFYNTETAAITAYKLGEIDTIEDLTSPNGMRQWGTTRVTPLVRYDRIVSLFFNLTNPVLKEKSVRQGLAYAIPEFDEERAVSPISKLSWAYTDKVKKYPYEPATAKKLLSNALSASMSARLTIATFDQYADSAQSIAKSWTDIGIPTSVKVVNAVPDDYDVLLSAQEVPPDPDQYPFWHQTQTQTNITHYANVKIDKLLEDGRQQWDVEERKKIYADFQRRLVDDAPAIFLYYAKTYTVER